MIFMSVSVSMTSKKIHIRVRGLSARVRDLTKTCPCPRSKMFGVRVHRSLRVIVFIRGRGSHSFVQSAKSAFDLVAQKALILFISRLHKARYVTRNLKNSVLSAYRLIKNFHNRKLSCYKQKYTSIYLGNIVERHLWTKKPHMFFGNI